MDNICTSEMHAPHRHLVSHTRAEFFFFQFSLCCFSYVVLCYFHFETEEKEILVNNKEGVYDEQMSHETKCVILHFLFFYSLESFILLMLLNLFLPWDLTIVSYHSLGGIKNKELSAQTFKTL